MAITVSATLPCLGSEKPCLLVRAWDSTEVLRKERLFSHRTGQLSFHLLLQILSPLAESSGMSWKVFMVHTSVLMNRHLNGCLPYFAARFSSFPFTFNGLISLFFLLRWPVTALLALPSGFH